MNVNNRLVCLLIWHDTFSLLFFLCLNQTYFKYFQGIIYSNCKKIHEHIVMNTER